MKRPTLTQYPVTDERSFVDPEGKVDWKKYANALDNYITDTNHAHESFINSLKRTIDNQQRANKMLVDQVMRLSIYEELIDFAVFLTGHDRETIEQMYNNWKNTK